MFGIICLFAAHPPPVEPTLSPTCPKFFRLTWNLVHSLGISMVAFFVQDVDNEQQHLIAPSSVATPGIASISRSLAVSAPVAGDRGFQNRDVRNFCRRLLFLAVHIRSSSLRRQEVHVGFGKQTSVAAYAGMSTPQIFLARAWAMWRCLLAWWSGLRNSSVSDEDAGQCIAPLMFSASAPCPSPDHFVAVIVAVQRERFPSRC